MKRVYLGFRLLLLEMTWCFLCPIFGLIALSEETPQTYHIRQREEDLDGVHDLGSKSDTMDTTRSLNSEISYAFQIKMFWEEGMRWQNETMRKQYCIECASDCEKGDQCYSATCSEGRRLMITMCEADDIDQFWRTDGERVSPERDGDLCWTRSDKYVRLYECDILDQDQEFTRIDEFNEFQIRPLSHRDEDWKEADCLSNPHHPKSGEPTKWVQCRLAERNDRDKYDDTSRWVVGVGFDGHSGKSNWDWDEGGYFPADGDDNRDRGHVDINSTSHSP